MDSQIQLHWTAFPWEKKTVCKPSREENEQDARSNMYFKIQMQSAHKTVVDSFVLLLF